MRTLSAKSVVFVTSLALMTAVLLPILIFLRHPDASVWLTAAILIAVIMAFSIPLAVSLHRNPGWGLRVPWPTPAATQDPADERPRPQVTGLSGNFTWTAQEFARMRNAWLRYTPAGRNHRRRTYVLSTIAFASMVAACIWLSEGQFMASILLLASAALLVLVFSDRIRELDEVRSRAHVSWELVPDGLLHQTEGAKRKLPWASINAILRTRDGFLIWPGDLRETWLPVNAFHSPKDAEVFSEIARSEVENYVHAN